MKIFILAMLGLMLCGCVTAPMNYNPELGMTKRQLYADRGDPASWTRQVINGHTYETWGYIYAVVGTYDFVDDVLVGYSKRPPFGNSKYISKDKEEDLTDFAE